MIGLLLRLHHGMLPLWLITNLLDNTFKFFFIFFILPPSRILSDRSTTRELDLHMSHMPAQDLISVAQQVSGLKELSVAPSSDEVVHEFVSRNPELEVLHLYHCHTLSAKGTFFSLFSLSLKCNTNIGG